MTLQDAVEIKASLRPIADDIRAIRAGIPITDGGGSVTIDTALGPIAVTGTVAVTGPITATIADEYAEDIPHVSSDTGGFVLAVRHDADTTMVSTDGDYAAFQQDASGRLKVNVLAGTVGISGTVPISAAALPLPAGASTEATLAALNAKVTTVNTGAVVISGTVPVSAAALPLPTGASTEATLAALNAKVTAVNTGAVVLAAGAATVGKVDQGAAGASAWKVDGSAVTQPVSLASVPSHPVTNAGTFAVQATLASVPLPTGAATETTLAALNTKVTAVNTGAVVISGALPAGAAVIGKVDQGTGGASAWKVDGSAVTQPVSIAGTVAVTGASAGTEYTEDAASIANPVGGQLMARRRDTLASETTTDGDVTALNSTASGELYVHAAQLPTALAAGGGIKIEGVAGGVAVPVSGTVAIGAFVTNYEYATDDATHAASIGAYILGRRNDAAAVFTDTDGDFSPIAVTNKGSVIIAVTAPIDVNIVSTGGLSFGTLDAADYAEDSAHSSGQTGSFVMGVRNDTATTSLTSTNGDYSPIAVDIKGRVFTDGSTVTQPVSAAALPLPAGASTEATLAALNAKVTACNTGAVVVSAALPAGANAIGKLAANSGVDIGDVDVTSVPADPFGVNADAASATGSISAKLRFIAATGIPITGTVTVGSHAVTNAGTFASQETQVIADNAGFTDGTSKVWPVGLIFDEVAGTALTENDVGAARMDSKRAAVYVMEDATTRGQRATVSAAGAVKVDGSGVTQPISVASLPSVAVTNAGTFAVQATANAGTNLNTSALALEAGNLATAVASLSVLDDWDETDRAKVNTIAGQVGVQGASGVVTALTQRVVLATDVALPAGTNGIGKLTANSGVVIGDVNITTLPAAVEAAYATGKLAFGSITGTHATLVTAGNPAKIGTIFNATNQPVIVSFDASTTHGYIPAFSSWDIPYQEAALKESSNVSIKHDGTAPSTGAVYGNLVTA